jgi:hypothetical protein
MLLKYFKLLWREVDIIVPSYLDASPSKIHVLSQDGLHINTKQSYECGTTPLNISSTYQASLEISFDFDQCLPKRFEKLSCAIRQLSTNSLKVQSTVPRAQGHELPMKRLFHNSLLFHSCQRSDFRRFVPLTKTEVYWPEPIMAHIISDQWLAA